MHAEQILLFGGTDGLRDAHSIASAVASPQNVWYYAPDASIFEIAVAYAYHIAQNQAFLDGNKRTALQAALVFLAINGYRVETGQKNLFEEMHKLHLGPEAKAGFAVYLRQCSVREGGFTQWVRSIFRS